MTDDVLSYAVSGEFDIFYHTYYSGFIVNIFYFGGTMSMGYLAARVYRIFNKSQSLIGFCPPIFQDGFFFRFPTSPLGVYANSV